ncbi:MAG: 30S ribosome-binding factor RbfA [Candidatus Latescibacterota bacterium]|nr:30S ribosome-binding factor RbfA [Candidatus Latescibacterota bacterium]
MASPQRVNKIKVQLQREIGDIIQNMSDPRLDNLSVSDVTITRDLSVATLYVSVLSEETEQKAAINAISKALGHIRSQIAKRIHLRYAPELRVQYDPTGERAARVLSLIDSIQGSKEND